MHETEERHAAGGLYEAEGPGLPAEASDGERRTLEVDTGQPIPHEVDSTALARTFELQSPTHRRDTHPTGDPSELANPCFRRSNRFSVRA